MEAIETTATGTKIVETDSHQRQGCHYVGDNAFEARLARDSWHTAEKVAIQESRLARDSWFLDRGSENRFQALNEKIRDVNDSVNHQFAAVQVAAVKDAAAAALAAATNAAQIRADIAECCCETKVLIQQSKQDVLDRVNAIEVKAQDRLLNDANAKITALTILLNKYLPPSCAPVL